MGTARVAFIIYDETRLTIRPAETLILYRLDALAVKQPGGLTTVDSLLRAPAEEESTLTLAPGVYGVKANTYGDMRPAFEYQASLTKGGMAPVVQPVDDKDPWPKPTHKAPTGIKVAPDTRKPNADEISQAQWEHIIWRGDKASVPASETDQKTFLYVAGVSNRVSAVKVQPSPASKWQQVWGA